MRSAGLKIIAGGIMRRLPIKPGADLEGFLVSRNPFSKSHKLNSLTLIGLLISHPASNNPNL